MTTNQCEMCDQPGTGWFSALKADGDVLEVWVCDTHYAELDGIVSYEQRAIQKLNIVIRRAQQHKAQQAIERERAKGDPHHGAM
jgi:hypothetical protein